MARFLLVEAAQTASRDDEELRRDDPRLKFRRGTAVAKVAIARKYSDAYGRRGTITEMLGGWFSPEPACRADLIAFAR